MAKHFVIEKIDVDGDGIPDGDLVKEYEGDKLLSQKFVPKEKMAEIVDNALNQQNGNSGPKEKIVYKNEPQNIDNKPIVIKDNTNFDFIIQENYFLTNKDDRKKITFHIKKDIEYLR